MKKLVISLVVLAVSLLLVSGLAPAKEFTAIVVTDVGGLGDKSFNDAGWLGVQMAAKKLGIKGEFIQSMQQTDYVSNLSAAAQKADVVVALGFLMADAVQKVAPLFPKTKFVLIDFPGDKKITNLASYLFKAGQSGFLVGIVAAATSNSNKVGALQGMAIPPVLAWTAGYRCGIKAWNEVKGDKVELIVKTAGTFNDPAKGKALTLAMVGQGADIVFNVAGNTGVGIFEAVKELNKAAGITPEDAKNGKKPKYFAIGVDMNQDWVVPGEVLTSGLKVIPNVVASAIEDAYNGKFKAGVHVVGYAEGAAGISDMKYTKNFVSKEALDLVKKAEALMAKNDPALDFPPFVEDEKKFADSWKVPEALK